MKTLIIALILATTGIARSDSIDDAEAARRGVPASTIQIERLQKKIVELQSLLKISTDLEADDKKEISELKGKLDLAVGELKKVAVALQKQEDEKNADPAQASLSGPVPKPVNPIVDKVPADDPPPQLKPGETEDFGSFAKRFANAFGHRLTKDAIADMQKDPTIKHSAEASLLGADVVKTDSLLYPIQGVAKVSAMTLIAAKDSSFVLSYDSTYTLKFANVKGKWRLLGGNCKSSERKDTGDPVVNESDVAANSDFGDVAKELQK
jgi:hypothetical protein